MTGMGSDCMNFAIHEYYNSVLREKFEPQAIGTLEKYRIIRQQGMMRGKQTL
jgi:hypothetical protein